MSSSDLISIAEATKRLSISRNTLLARLRHHQIPIYGTETDRRRRLVDWSQVEKALRAEYRTVGSSRMSHSDDFPSQAFSALVSHERGQRLDVVQEDDVSRAFRLLANGIVDSMPAWTVLVADLLEGEAEFCAGDVAPFPVRDSFPTRVNTSVGFITRWDGPIRGIWDIRPGARIAQLSTPAPMMWMVNQALLAWIQLDTDSVRLVPFGAWDDAVRAVAAGDVDIAYVTPASQICREVEASGVRLRWLDMNPTASERDAEGAERHRSILPRFTFAPNGFGVPDSLGFWGHQVEGSYGGRFVRADAEPELVYRIVNWRFEQSGSLVPNPMTTVRAALPKLVIPVHDGAIACFRERGLWTEVDDARQKFNTIRLNSYIGAWRHAAARAAAQSVSICFKDPAWLAIWRHCKSGLGPLRAVSDEAVLAACGELPDDATR